MPTFALSRWTLVAALAALAVGAVAPTAAAAEAQAAGPSGAQARCRYEITQAGTFGWTEAQLRRIVVTPPTIYGLRSGQSVGWRFSVRRSIDGAAEKVTYRSPIQRATAGPARAASLTKMSVAVGLPSIPPGADWELPDVHYRMVLKMFWFRSDGSVEQKINHQFRSHRQYLDGTYELSEEYCAGELRQFFDGPGD